ncbi:AraC family transcriptional regulator [Vulcaniibacterium tengchongense]|uniref:AraC family transcriptional regulator n=1 Tax=Vulcaniibacterium tengchongense TaxID=1273429 RepID=A0A3N4VJH9_9GAMM|nr:AraC family transcriptional regulator [Vulcaniibacterium tengchongense]RPE79481.1 AraC family transcriptional regulator [Vulcaniibacterium tengchongense]
MSLLSPSETIAQQSLTAPQAELADRIARSTPGDGIHPTALPQLQLVRCSRPTPCTPNVFEPRLCIVVQGSKIALLGDQVYHYDPLNYLVVSMTLPMMGQVVEATPEKPYLCLRLDIEPEQIAGLLLDTGAQAGASPGAGSARAAYAARVTPALLDAVLRLMRLLDEPEDLPVLAPMAMREIFYRVLLGDLGHHLRAVAMHDSRPQRIAKAVELLRQRYLEPLRIEELARSVHMSVSSLHHNFKAATTMSPLQYQKQLRLHEARRLMLTEGLEASAAAHRVGYESPSQFSREYKRLFGAPPRAEIAQIRAAAAG